MSQLQKRCFFASMGAHGLLLVGVLVGSAFFLPEKPPISHEALRVIPSRLVDEALSGGGGNPNVPPEPERQIETPQPQPPKPQPPKPEPPKPEPRKEPVKEPPKEVAKPKESRKVSLDDLKLQPRRKPSKPAPQQQSDIAKEIAKVRESLKGGLQQQTQVEIHGPGGEAYANYAAFVKMVYDNNWVITDSVTDNGAITRVQVVIARDGDVVSSRILRPSGNAALDQSVQRTLDKVRFVAPFPAGAKERTRTFTIEFNLRNKLGSG